MIAGRIKNRPDKDQHTKDCKAQWPGTSEIVSVISSNSKTIGPALQPNRLQPEKNKPQPQLQKTPHNPPNISSPNARQIHPAAVASADTQIQIRI